MAMNDDASAPARIFFGPSPMDSLSVIVTAHDNARVIAGTLASAEAALEFFRASHPRGDEVQAEIVVVDDGSTDGTFAAVEEFANAKSACYRLIRRPQASSPSCARNAGADVAKGALLYFLD